MLLLSRLGLFRLLQVFTDDLPELEVRGGGVEPPVPGNLHPVPGRLRAVQGRPHVQLGELVTAGLEISVVVVDHVPHLLPAPEAHLQSLSPPLPPSPTCR